MVNYANGKIYCIRSYQTDDIYIGSTCQTLSQRLTCHKTQYKRYTEGNRKKNITSFDILKYGDAYIELIELHGCNQRCELLKREGEIIRDRKCVNKFIPGRTQKQYREDNKDEIKEYNKQYREDNKDKINQWREDNKDKINQWRKQYYQDNKNKIDQKNKQWYQNNKDKIKQWRKQYREDNKDIIKEYTKKYNKQYREDNKDKIKDINKQYYQDNKDKINQKQRQYYQYNKDKIKEKVTCECGVIITKPNKSRHLKSKKHQDFIQNNNVN